MPAFTFVVEPFACDYCCHLEAVIIINEGVFVATKDVDVNDQLEDSIYKRGFIRASGEWSGMEVPCELCLFLIVPSE